MCLALFRCRSCSYDVWKHVYRFRRDRFDCGGTEERMGLRRWKRFEFATARIAVNSRQVE